MPAVRESPLRSLPRSVSDTLDGDNSPPGAMSSLSNLIFDPSTPNVLVCRPANLELTTFPGLSTPGVVSAGFQLNGVIYGMIATVNPTGKDRPFAYVVATATFLTVTGITSANCPTTQPTTGVWTPPDMDAVGSRIIVTHPGFNFVGGYAFGYFDISGFSASITGDVVSGSPTVHGNFSIAGIGPGYPITGTSIPASTTVTNVKNVAFSVTGDTHTSTTIDNITSTANLYVGQAIAGLGIPTGATIATIVGANSITISSAATATNAGISLAITGTEITMSANATGSHNAQVMAVAGGTTGSPLWAAGNTTGATQLASVPQTVRQFNNRAYFGAGNQLIFTDTLSLNISNASGVQVLTVGDTSPIIALEGLPEYTSSSGVLQALLAFKQYAIGQINGDISLGTLALNILSDSVGTAAARSVATTPNGVAFMASDGLRNVNLVGEVSEINTDLALPFIYAAIPSRVAAAFNSDIYRICVQNTNHLGSPYEDYHFNFKYDAWTGPHTFRYDLAVPYSNDFIVFNNAIPASMWQAYSVQNHNAAGNTFIENGTQLIWEYKAAPMTDTGNMYANCCVRTTLDLALPSTGEDYLFQAIDVDDGVVATATVRTLANQAVWGIFIWGAALWGSAPSGLASVTIPWTQPPIFNKMIFRAQGPSSLALKIGSTYVGYEKLGYLKQ